MRRNLTISRGVSFVPEAPNGEFSWGYESAFFEFHAGHAVSFREML
jgi:hypothetical protein